MNHVKGICVDGDGIYESNFFKSQDQFYRTPLALIPINSKVWYTFFQKLTTVNLSRKEIKMFSTSRHSSIRDFFINWKTLVALGSLLIVVLIGAFIASHFLSVAHTTLTVNKMERVQDSNGSKYLIYTKEGEVFENTDNLLFGKFNSSDLYNKLNEGQTYTCKVNGFRIPLMSSYRNILSCE